MPYADCESKKIYYEDRGDGPALLFAHPPGMGRKTFIKQFPLQNSYRLLIPDFSGHGDSSSSNNEMTVLSSMKEIEAIRKHAGVDELFLFGYSAGGIIVQEYAIRFPTHVKGVILSGGYPKVNTETLKVEHQIGILMVKHVPKILAKILSISHFAEKSLQQEMYQHILKANQHTWRTFYQASLHFNCSERLSKMNAPLLLLYGTGADYVNDHVRLYNNFIDTEVRFINAIGHQLPTRKPKEVNDLVDQFVRRQIKLL